MPLLAKEPDLFPIDLFTSPSPSGAPWLVAHVQSRQEKTLARHLLRQSIPYYLPQAERKTKRSGRTFRSYLPLFAGYVFFRAEAGARDVAWRSNVIANILEVPDQDLLHTELQQLRRLQELGASLTPHLEIVAGTPVRITDGVFSGYSGIVLREKQTTRLIVTISHLHRAVAVELSRDSVDIARKVRNTALT